MTSGPLRQGRERPGEGLHRGVAPGLGDKQSQVLAGGDQGAIDLALRDRGRGAGRAGVPAEPEGSRGGAVQGVLGLGGYGGGADDAHGKVMRRRLVEAGHRADCRYILRFEPLASLPADDVVAAIAPSVQRYLTL
ncbi:MAG TPA: hypothetical protein VI365_09355 [Trebonia sp.]